MNTQSCQNCINQAPTGGLMTASIHAIDTPTAETNKWEAKEARKEWTRLKPKIVEVEIKIKK